MRQSMKGAVAELVIFIKMEKSFIEVKATMKIINGLEITQMMKNRFLLTIQFIDIAGLIQMRRVQINVKGSKNLCIQKNQLSKSLIVEIFRSIVLTESQIALIHYKSIRVELAMNVSNIARTTFIVFKQNGTRKCQKLNKSETKKLIIQFATCFLSVQCGAKVLGLRHYYEDIFLVPQL